MSDETQLSSSESNEEQTEEQKQQSLNNGTDSDKPDTEGKPAMVPSHRLREETEKRREAEKVSSWYRENIGDPEDVLAFRQWKAEQAKAAPSQADDKEELTPAQLNAVKKLVAKVYPWLEKINPDELSEVIQTRKEAREVMELTTVDEVNRLADEAGMSKNQDDRDRLTYLVGAEIGRNPNLTKLWKAGNPTVIAKAFEAVKGFYRTNGGTVADAKTKRQVTKLPTPPSGGSASLSARNPEKREKGLDGKAGKEAADEAWALINRE